MEIPKEVKFVIEELKKHGFQAYVVGGCVRDLLRKVEPQDWDVATNAKPVQIGKIFLRSYADNKFGTVTVLTGSQGPKLKEIEITPFRIDEKYTDKRHPDKIRWAKTIEEDLARRDFTINAIALDLRGRPGSDLGLTPIDPFNGQKDLKNKIIRAVGKAEERFSEDALRMLRAVRFATTLDFEANEAKASSSPFARRRLAWEVDEAKASSSPFARRRLAWVIEEKTAKAIEKNSFWLKMISKERIRDEFLKIIMAKKAADGLELLRKLGLLKYIVPELEEGFGVSQNKHHIYECYEHSLLSLKYAAETGYNKYVRLAALFHDIAKPRTKKGEGPEATFYSHEIVGAKMTAQILNRLKFSKKDIEKIVKLVRYHLFYYNVDEVSDSSVRRLVRKVGPENMEELLQVRHSDRIGSGCPKAEPYKLRHLRYIIEKVSQDPISVKMLKVSGKDVMRILNIQPGPRVGHVLDVLLGYVLSNPKKNKKEFLEKEIERLGKLSEKDLISLAQKAKEERDKIIVKRDEMTKKKYWVT